MALTLATLPLRILGRIAIRGSRDCWPWLGKLNDKGYGFIRWEGHTYTAHHLIYLLLVGKVPRRHVVDHLCRIRHCVNTRHLEPVTHQVNLLRGLSPSAINARKHRCDNGHRYTSKTVYSWHGHRRCKICHSVANSRWAEKRRLAS